MKSWWKYYETQKNNDQKVRYFTKYLMPDPILNGPLRLTCSKSQGTQFWEILKKLENKARKAECLMLLWPSRQGAQIQLCVTCVHKAIQWKQSHIKTSRRNLLATFRTLPRVQVSYTWPWHVMIPTLSFTNAFNERNNELFDTTKASKRKLVEDMCGLKPLGKSGHPIIDWFEQLIFCIFICTKRHHHIATTATKV